MFTRYQSALQQNTWALWVSHVSWKLNFPSLPKKPWKDDLSWRWTSGFLSRLGERLLSPAVMPDFFGHVPIDDQVSPMPQPRSSKILWKQWPARHANASKKRGANHCGLAHHVSTWTGVANERQMSLEVLWAIDSPKKKRHPKGVPGWLGFSQD